MTAAGGDTDQPKWTVTVDDDLEWLSGYGLLDVAEGAIRGYEWAQQGYRALVALVRDHAAATRERDAAVQAVDLLSQQAVIVAHHLLDYAPKDSLAESMARMLLSTINVEARTVLGADMRPMCPECGTSGNEAVINSSHRHARCSPAARAALGDTPRSVVRDADDESSRETAGFCRSMENGTPLTCELPAGHDGPHSFDAARAALGDTPS